MFSTVHIVITGRRGKTTLINKIKDIIQSTWPGSIIKDVPQRSSSVESIEANLKLTVYPPKR